MTRRTALRILALAAFVGLLAQGLLLDNLLGVNAPILSGALLGTAWLVRPADRQVDALDWWLPAGALAVSAGIAVRADPTLVVIDALAACLLLGASMAAFAGLAVTRRSVLAVVELGLLVLGWAGVGILRVTSAATRRDRAVADRADDPRPIRQRFPAWAPPVARGLLLAIPIVLVFTSLFAAADAAFGRLVGRLFVLDLDLGQLVVRLTVAFVIGWAVAGLLAVASGQVIDPEAELLAAAPPAPPAPVPQSLGAAAAGLPSVEQRREATLLPFRLGAIEAATILVAVDILFAIFVALQVAYLFGGLDTLAATGLPYAQYARSGFFELVRVAVLAGALLATVHALADRRTGLLVGSGLALAGLTAIVLASALLRLRIYQDAYGWTELRFYVLAAIVWLAIGIGITVVLLVRDRMRWLLHGLAMAAVVVLIGVNVVGPARVIAEENVARVLNPSLVPPDGRSGLDVDYAAELGDDAIPALVRALPAVHGTDQVQLQTLLLERRFALRHDDGEGGGWPSWNLGRERAREALEALAP